MLKTEVACRDLRSRSFGGSHTSRGVALLEVVPKLALLVSLAARPVLAKAAATVPQTPNPTLPASRTLTGVCLGRRPLRLVVEAANVDIMGLSTRLISSTASPLSHASFAPSSIRPRTPRPSSNVGIPIVCEPMMGKDCLARGSLRLVSCAASLSRTSVIGDAPCVRWGSPRACAPPSPSNPSGVGSSTLEAQTSRDLVTAVPATCHAAVPSQARGSHAQSR